ncbi:MAG: isoamylase early set domain-containing protein [Gemmatimonadaceae bacterium]|nr:isoamylase early set domain-containing protein [Gemmatimonadaceae bacterium]
MTKPDLNSNDDALDALLQQAVFDLRAPVAVRRPALDALKAAVRAEAAGTITPRVAVVSASAPVSTAQAPAAERARQRWFTSRSLRTSPIGLLAAASLLIAATALITSRVVRDAGGAPGTVAVEGRPPAGAAAEVPRVVRFTLAAPDARRVSLVGDFNGWDPAATALVQQDGTWTVVIPVTPGRHQYGFVIDGSTWIADPDAPKSADSDYGSSNSVMYVGG